MMGGNSFMRGPGGPGRGPGGFGHGPGGHRPGGHGPGGLGHRRGGFRPYHRRGWGGPPPPSPHRGCGCMGCLLPVLVIGGALFTLAAFIL